ncbi:MAG: PAS domain-containing protein [Nitrospirae bacterium]|nr:MAG: PAS domain-containing protein [Nitrospirota bacterium]
MLKDRYSRTIFLIFILLAASLPVINFYVIYPSFSQLIVKNSENEAVRLASRLRDSVVTADYKMKSASDIRQDMDTLMMQFGIMKLKTFNSTGEVVYSSDSKEIGEINQKTYFHSIVAKGRPYTKLIKKDSKSLEDQYVVMDVVETYVPIMSKNQFVGAFEIYYDVTKRIKDLNSVLTNATIIPAAVFFLFFIALIITLGRQNAYVSRVREKEEALKNVCDSTRKVFDSITYPICVIDAEDYRILSANRTFIEEFGTGDQDIIGKTCYAVTHRRSDICTAPDDACPLIDSKLTGKPVSIEHVHYNKNKQKKFVEVSVYPIKDENGRLTRVVHIEKDITGIKSGALDADKSGPE